MHSLHNSSFTPFYAPVEFDHKDHAQRIDLANEMIVYLDVAIAAKAYSDAIDSNYGTEILASSIRNESRDLLQRFVMGQTQLGMATGELKEKLTAIKRDAKREVRYAKRLHLWTRIFELIFGKENFKAAADACKVDPPQIDFAPILFGISLALSAIWLVNFF